MKRVVCALLILCIIPAFVFAESVDLSAMSFDELRELQTRISKELTTRPEWKSVPVPPGIYKVGVDIPVGEWTITCGKSEYGLIFITYSAKTNESGTTVEAPYQWFGNLYEESNGEKLTSYTMTMVDGYYISIDGGQAIFTTPERVDLGF